MKYQRFISYLYQYIEGEKEKNTGYVKVEQKQGTVRISLRSKLMEQDEGEYFVFLIGGTKQKDGHYHGMLLDVVSPSEGMLIYQYISGQEETPEHHLSVDDYIGVLIRGRKHAAYMTIWQEAEVWPDEIICVDEQETAAAEEEKPEEMEVAEEEKPEEITACGEEKPEDIVQEAKAAEGVDYLFEHRNLLPPVKGSQLMDCIRIEPQDIGLLHMQNWKYGNNSFLNHSYYRYRYLLLGKLKFQDNTVKMILGVPGIYTSREKYLANMFGFEQFVTVKRTDRKINQFGYWLVELVS